MTQIGGADRVMLLLRERLRQREDARTGATARADGRIASPQARIAALAASRDLPERDFRHAVVRGLLGERLGEALSTDPAFEAVSAEVLRIIEGSDEARALLDRVAAEFRGA